VSLFARRALVLAACALALAADVWAATPQAQAQDPNAPPPARNSGRAGPAAARPGQPPRPGGPGDASVDGLSAGQVEQMFDQYVLGEARIALQLSPSQLVPFGRRLQQLQMVRRRGQRQRQELLNDLNTVTRETGPVDDAALTAKIKALDDLTADLERQAREAYAAVDETLTVRQRARFRIFEQRMERQKLDLIAHARQAARQGGAAQGGDTGP
jgi:hypothetical protein